MKLWQITRERELTQLEKEGAIRRFEYSWELAWKLLKDYLEGNGVVLDVITPAAVIKAAFAARVIDDGDVWMRALDARNTMSHTYNFKMFEQTIADIQTEYLAILERLSVFMLGKNMEESRG